VAGFGLVFTNAAAAQPTDDPIFPVWETLWFRGAEGAWGDSKLIDLDNDGDLDLLFWRPGGVLPCFNDGRGFFTKGAEQQLPGDPGEQFALHDFDGDGFPDLVQPVSSPMQILKNDGTGVFNATMYEFAVAVGPSFGDLDGDGDLDTVRFDRPNTWFENVDGENWIQHDSVVPAGGIRIDEGKLVDVNNDGLSDLVMVECTYALFTPAQLEAGVSVCLNTGGGVFAPPVELAEYADAVIADDIDGDGNIDVLLIDGQDWSDPGWQSSINELLIGNGDGTFQPFVAFDFETPAIPPVTQGTPVDFAADRISGDLDGNGLIDGPGELRPLYLQAATDFSQPLFLYGPPRIVRLGFEVLF